MKGNNNLNCTQYLHLMIVESITFLLFNTWNITFSISILLVTFDLLRLAKHLFLRFAWKYGSYCDYQNH